MKHRPLYQPRSSAAPGTGANEAVRLRAVSKVSRSRGWPVAALREVSVAFVAGSFTAAMSRPARPRTIPLTCRESERP